MSTFQAARNVELSVVEYIKTQIDASWSNITTIKSFSQAYKESLPIVCVRLREFPPSFIEVGSKSVIYDYNIIVDIFANSDGQKNDLANFIMDKLKEGCTYYEFAQVSGAPETVSKTANGRLHIKEFLNNTSLDFGENADKYDQHRFFIAVNMRKD